MVRASDEECKNAFLQAAGITDPSPYVDMDARQTIDTVLEALGMSNREIGTASGISRQAIDNLLQRAPKSRWSASSLGTRLAPALDNAAEAGRIIRESGARDLQWRPEPDKKHNEIFYQILGINPEPKELAPLATQQVLHHYWQILYYNAGLTYETITKRFYPPVNHSFLSRRIEGYQQIDLDFIEQFAYAILPELKRGIEERWLDAQSKLPRLPEDILRDRLGAEIVGEAKGLEAILHCIKKSALPLIAVSVLCGRESNWIVHKRASGKYQLRPVEVLRIADVIAPYVRGEKQWNGVVEFENAEFMHNHSIVRDYVVATLKAALPNRIAEIEGALTPLPDTLGPVLKRLREEAGLSQFGFQPQLAQPRYSHLELNYFNPNCIEENGEINAALKTKLDHIIAVVAEHWQVRDRTPGTEVAGAEVTHLGHLKGKEK